MTAHDDDRDPGQQNTGHGARDGIEYDDADIEYDDIEYADIEYDGTAYDGTDALMAAILDEPLPARGRRDPAFRAAHGAAVADLTVLREQLALIGDALAAPAGAVPAGGEDGAPAGRDETARPGKRPEPGDGTGQGGRARPPGGPDPRSETGNRPAVPGAGPRDRPAVTGTRVRPGPGGPGGPGGPVRPGGSRGPRRVRRPLKAAFGALVAAAAATVVLGTGWLVAQGGGAADEAAGSKAVTDSMPGEQAGGVAFGSPRYLACARLVAEGTVVAVEPLPDAGRERITLQVSRAHKGTENGHRVTFVPDTAGQPRLREGDRVMIGMPPEGDRPDEVIVGDDAIALERTRITASLPESRTLPCG